MHTRMLRGKPCGASVRALGKACEGLRRGTGLLLSLVAMIGVVSGAVMGAPRKSKREQITKLVVRIQRADYEGDQAALQHLFQDLSPFVDDKELGAKVRYWRGFAQWRRAFNGFNDSVAQKELEQDLKQAINEFEDAIAKEPAFVDARVAAGSSMGVLMFLHRSNRLMAPELSDPERLQAFGLKALSYMNEAETAEPEKPRVLWVLGQTRWNLPVERGGGQDKAFETYQKGLKAAREHKGTMRDPLMPSWGEPELLMNLAYSNMARSAPDLTAAEQYARAALALVPYWHYVRDILIPQIETAKAKHRSANLNPQLDRAVQTSR